MVLLDTSGIRVGDEEIDFLVKIQAILKEERINIKGVLFVKSAHSSYGNIDKALKRIIQQTLATNQGNGSITASAWDSVIIVVTKMNVIRAESRQRSLVDFETNFNQARQDEGTYGTICNSHFAPV